MTAFNDELQRRLREVLSTRVRAPLSSDVPVVIRAREGRYDDALGMQRPEIEIATTQHPYAAWSYEEPGAWEMLLEDLAAVSEAPTAPEASGPAVAHTVSQSGLAALRGAFQVPTPVGPNPNRDPIAWPLPAPDKDVPNLSVREGDATIDESTD